MRLVCLAGMTGLALVLAACGGGADEPTPADSPTSEPSEAPVPTDVTPEPEDSPLPEPTATQAAEQVSEPTVAAIEPPAGFAMCKACHATEPGKQGIGPSLAGVYGTKAGEVAGFEFSEAMIASGIRWDDASLDAYLQNPRKLVPGTKMSFGGMNDATKRKEVIAFLKLIK